MCAVGPIHYLFAILYYFNLSFLSNRIHTHTYTHTNVIHSVTIGKEKLYMRVLWVPRWIVLSLSVRRVCVYFIYIYSIRVKPRRFHPHETSSWRGVSRLERMVYLVVVGLCDLPYKDTLFTGCSYSRS